MDPILERLSTSVTSARTVEELTRPLLELLEAVTGLESTYLTTVDLQQGVQKILYARNTSRLDVPEGLTVQWEDTLCKRALESNQPFTSDVAACWGDSEAARQLGIQTYVSTPVLMGDGAMYGTLCAASADQHSLAPEAQRLLALFATLIAHQIEREQLVAQLLQANERLTTYATTDTLTALANRRALLQELTRLLAQGRRQGFWVLVAFVDLDGFKAINDRHGHSVGDQFLVEMAARMKKALRGDDFAARLGGDEFVVIGLGPGESHEVEAAREAFQQRVFGSTVGDIPLADIRIAYGGASVGVLAVEPGQHDAAQVLERADALMYEAKVSRRASV